jgi:myo-inositol catabolism protein IolC
MPQLDPPIEGAGLIRHIVLFSLEDADSPEAEQLLASLRALPRQVPEIRGLMLGRPINDGAHQFALTVDLDDEEALARYRAHPDHVPVVERLRALSSKIVVADIAD